MKPFIFSLILLTCPLISEAQRELTTLAGQAISEDDLQTTRITVLVFMSPECPLCENYAATLKSLRPLFSEDEVSFIGVFSGSWYSQEEIIRYMARYKPPVQPVMDPSYVLRDKYEATVTPETVLLDASGEVIYQGKIDNWIVSLGKKRTVVTEYYLQEALSSWSRGEYPEVRQTEAVGCFIE